MLKSYGKVTITTPGTPVRATVNEPHPDDYAGCNAILIQVWPTNAGIIYVGDRQAMNKSTGEGLLAILAPPTTNFIPSFSATLPYSTGGLDASFVWIDADNGSEGVLVSAVIG